MHVSPTELPDVKLITPNVFEDPRGFFLESYSLRRFVDHGITVNFVQDNHSRSTKGVLRGLHYQLMPGQAKLVRAVRGTIFDVAVDIRIGSPTFGKWVGATLSEANKQQMFIPVGFAHGFCVTSDVAEVEYKVDTYYTPEMERGIAWDDSAIGIDWPLGDPILSARDGKNPRLEEADIDFHYEV